MDTPRTEPTESFDKPAPEAVPRARAREGPQGPLAAPDHPLALPDPQVAGSAPAEPPAAALAPSVALLTANRHPISPGEGPAIDANDLIDAFLAGRPNGTLRGYGGALRAFSRFAGTKSVAEAAGKLLGGTAGGANRIAFAWRAHLVEGGYAPSTINARLASLRALVKMARILGLVTWHLEVTGVRAEPYRDTRGPGRRGVRALLAEVEDAKTPKERRDRALVRLLTDLALRRGEAVSLDIEHIDLERGVALVRGKGKHGRVPVTLPEPTVAALRSWIEVRGAEPGPLFVGMSRGRPGGRLTGTSVARIIRQLGERAGIEGLRPHGLRHAAITQALDLTRGDIRAVQRFSRHADPRTLLVYDDAREDRGGEVARLVAAWR